MDPVTREQVYRVIDGERAYQDRCGADHIRPDLMLGEHLLALEHNLAAARDLWYRSSDGDYRLVLDSLRKVAAQAVLAMEENGVVEREFS